MTTPKPELSKKFLYRKCTINDLPALQECAGICFRAAHQKLNVPDQDIEDYIRLNYCDEVLGKEIQSKNSHFELIIDPERLKANGDKKSTDYVIGYCKVIWGEEQTDENYRKNLGALQLQRLYILPTYQNYKLGASLQQWAIQFAEQQGFAILWLTTHPKNFGAIRFYYSWGFEIVGEYWFTMGTVPISNHIMERKIVRGAKL